MKNKPLYRFLVIIGWASVVGGILDGLLLMHAVWVSWSLEWPLPALTLDQYFRDHLSWLYWVKQLAFLVLPEAVARWVFDLPALLYFPLRIALSAVIGYWAIHTARQMKAKQANA